MVYARDGERQRRRPRADDASGSSVSGRPPLVDDVLRLQRAAGNRAVTDALASGATRPGQGAGESGASTPAPDVIVQRAGPVDDALAKRDVASIDALTAADIAKARPDQRFQLISLELNGGGEAALPRLWDSFGGGIDAAAVAHPDEWSRSVRDHAGVMRQSREVKTLEAAFALDVRDVAWAYLRENDGLVTTELRRLGIPDADGKGAAPTAEQADALRKTQEAAAKLADAQSKREELRKTEIAFHRKFVQKGGQTLPEGGVADLEELYEPVSFDPDRSFSASDQPTDYVPGLRTWTDTYRQHVELTKLINACFTTHPALYALSRADSSGAKAGGAAKANPEQARKVLGDELRTVRANIAKAHDLVPSLALQMTPIHDQLLKNTVGAKAGLKRNWSNVFLKPLGDDVISQQQPGPWWQTLGVAALEGAAFVVVGLATGGIGPLLLAGGQAAISVAKYQALETTSRANVTPNTQMITDGEVNAAAAAAVINVAMAFLAAVGAARAAFAARVSSAAGRALAAELGEGVARNLLLELTPEAATVLKNKLGADLLKRIGPTMGGASLEKLAAELTKAEIEALLQRVPANLLGGLLERVGTAKLLNSLLGRCADPQQLGRLLERVPDPAMLDRLLAGVAANDLGKLEKVLSVLGEAQPGTLKFNIGGELESSAGSVIINPGRQAMPLDKLRSLKPEALVVEATAERIPFPDGSGRLIVGRKLPNSIDWETAAKEFNRVLQSGGAAQISVYGPPDQLRRALAANGFTVRPALAEGAEQLVFATKR